MQFCQGLTDKETAYQVSLKEPKNIEKAIYGIRWFQHVRQAIFGEKREYFYLRTGLSTIQMAKVVKTIVVQSSTDQDSMHMDMREENPSSEAHTYSGSSDQSCKVCNGSEPKVAVNQLSRDMTKPTK